MFKRFLILYFLLMVSVSFSQEASGGSGHGEGFSEAGQFFFRVNDLNQIVSVLDKLPVYQPRPISLPASMTWQTDSEFSTYISAFQALPIRVYSEVWDECKRCPFDKSGNPRFRFDYTSKSILPNENVASIDIPPGFSLSEKGVLRPRL